MSVGIFRPFKITTGFLDTVDDATPGLSVAFEGGVPSPYKGMLGATMMLTKAQAMARSTDGSLRQGLYRYVQFKAGTTAANAKGQVVYHDDPDNHIVTPDAPANARPIAGLTLNAVTKGNYGFIQLGGLAPVKFTATPADLTIGNFVFVVDGSNVADAIAIATAVTGGHLTRALGTAHETIVGGAVKLVWLRFIALNV